MWTGTPETERSWWEIVECDVDGAKLNGLDCLGCGWGYAEPNELREHGAYRVVPFVSELADAVNDYFTERQ